MRIVAEITALVVSKLALNGSRRRKLARARGMEWLEPRVVLSGTAITDMSSMPSSNSNDSILGSSAGDVVVGSNTNTSGFDQNTGDSNIGSTAGDTLGGPDSNDTVNGSNSGDSNIGSTGDDTLGGPNGDDTLIGSNSDDSTIGSTGDDTLNGSSSEGTGSPQVSVTTDLQEDGSRQLIVTVSNLESGATATLVFDGALDGNSLSVSGPGTYMLLVPSGTFGSASVELQSSDGTVLASATFNLN